MISLEQLPKETLFEHKDISGERRPKHSPEVSRRVRAEFFLDLMEETLKNYDEKQKENIGKEKSPLHNLEFFFKKSWDSFTEPVLEYEDMLADIITKEWESNGAKSRALNELKERRAKTLDNIKILIPNFRELDFEKQRKAVAKLYEGYAGFISRNEDKLKNFVDDINEGFEYGLKCFLNTEQNELLQEEIERELVKKARKKEAQSAEITPEEHQ